MGGGGMRLVSSSHVRDSAMMGRNEKRSRALARGVTLTGASQVEPPLASSRAPLMPRSCAHLRPRDAEGVLEVGDDPQGPEEEDHVDDGGEAAGQAHEDEQPAEEAAVAHEGH